jgi:hypothetical protein
MKTHAIILVIGMLLKIVFGDTLWMAINTNACPLIRNDSEYNLGRIDSLIINTDNWCTYIIDISHNSKTNGVLDWHFSPSYDSCTRKRLYIDSFRLANNSDTLMIDDFEEYKYDTLCGGPLGSSINKMWDAFGAYNGSMICISTDTAIDNNYGKCLKVYYYNSFCSNLYSGEIVLYSQTGSDFSQFSKLLINIKRDIKDSNNNLSEIKNSVFPNDLIIGPNPPHGKLFIKTPSTIKEGKAFIYDIKGNIMDYFPITNNSGTVIDISKLPNGIFYLKIITAKRKYFNKFCNIK